MSEKHSDHAMQADFEASGAVFPKVEASRIDALLKNVIITTHIVPGTTTAIATAVLHFYTFSWVLASESASCDRGDLTSGLAGRLAIEKARQSAIIKLWELEGYALAQKFAAGGV